MGRFTISRLSESGVANSFGARRIGRNSILVPGLVLSRAGAGV